MDFIVNLPKFKSFDLIFGVMGFIKKMTHFLFCYKTITSKKMAQLFSENVYKNHENVIYLWLAVSTQVMIIPIQNFTNQDQSIIGTSY